VWRVHRVCCLKMATNAFDVLMRNATPVCPSDDPLVTAVIYEAHLEHVDPEEPLFRVPYFGQVVRPGTAEENFKARKYEHLCDAAREGKTLGFHAVIDMFGADAIEWRIVASESGRRLAMQTWADAEEKRLIAEHGGVLRDMDTTLEQTLNLANGGKGDAWWASIDAARRHALNKFKAAMEDYIDEHGTALVPQAFVTEHRYNLGIQLTNFRKGRMWKGMPEEADIVNWAEALPKWHWDARESDEYREALVQRGKDQWSNETPEKFADRMHKRKLSMDAKTDEEKSEIEHKRKATMATDASKAKRSKLAIDQWANASEETRVEWSANMSAAQLRPDVHAKHVKSGKDQAANETPEQKADRTAKTRATMATDASKAKRSNIGKDQWANASEETRAKWCAALSEAQRRPEVRANRIANTRAAMATDASKAKRSKIGMAQRENERRVELARARQIAVPFEKSKRRRAEMRAASDDNSGRCKNRLLYMVSEDGQTIRRVDKDGMMRERDIVGPVVDPAPPDAFDSD